MVKKQESLFLVLDSVDIVAKAFATLSLIFS